VTLCAGRVLDVTTGDSYSYNQMWFTTLYTDHVILKIQACQDAHILFSDSIGMGSNMYEAALGIIGNTRSVMREGPYDENVVWADTPGIMDCDKSKYVMIACLEINLLLFYSTSCFY
jgi:Farnesoic acid 0-methyl transferase